MSNVPADLEPHQDPKKSRLENHNAKSIRFLIDEDLDSRSGMERSYKHHTLRRSQVESNGDAGRFLQAFYDCELDVISSLTQTLENKSTLSHIFIDGNDVVLRSVRSSVVSYMQTQLKERLNIDPSITILPGLDLKIAGVYRADGIAYELYGIRRNEVPHQAKGGLSRCR